MKAKDSGMDNMPKLKRDFLGATLGIGLMAAGTYMGARSATDGFRSAASEHARQVQAIHVKAQSETPLTTDEAKVLSRQTQHVIGYFAAVVLLTPGTSLAARGLAPNTIAAMRRRLNKKII